MHPSETLRILATMSAPTASELSVAEKHYGTIASRLEQSFDVSRFIRIGSHARGTAIKTYSDIDTLAVLPRKSARWGDHVVAPRTFLSKIAEDLKIRYRSTSVRADGQAVVLYFAGGTHSVDVVPGIFEGMNGNRPTYLIPGTAERWIATSPETHDVIFSNANKRSGGKLGNLARLIKIWKYGREVPIPISSFYVDMLLSTSDLAAGVETYGHCLRDFFARLVQRDVRGLRDPGGVAGIITAGSSEGQLNRLFDAARFAREHADSALNAEASGKHAAANRQWGIVFNRNL